MASCRHWKQHWDPSADFVFLRRLRMGDDPENPYVLPGDPVTPEIRAKLGLNRLRRFWNAGAIGIADWAPESGREARPDSAPERTPKGPEKAPKKAPKKKTPKKASKKKTPKKASKKKKAKKKAPKAKKVASGTTEPTNEQVTEYEGLLAEGFTEAEAREVAGLPQAV